MKLRPFKKDGGGYGNLDMANQHESDKETPIRHGRQGKDEKGETYIGLPARNGKKMTLNKIQHTKVGDDIHFFVNGQENRGVVVKMGGTYVSVFKEDGNIHEIPINETFFVKDILVNKTWDDMSGEERAELLQNAHAYSPRFIAKNWDELPRELKTVLSDKATGMEQNHDKDNLEKEEANHAVTGYAQTQQNTLGKGEDSLERQEEEENSHDFDYRDVHGRKEKVAPAVGAAVGAGIGRAVGGYAGKKIGEKVAEHRSDKNPTRGRHPKKSLDDSLKSILELKSDVEAGKYGNAGSTSEVGVSTDTPLDVAADTGYEERPHISLEEVGQLPRADAKEHHANEVKETGKKQKIEPHEVKSKEKAEEEEDEGDKNPDGSWDVTNTSNFEFPIGHKLRTRRKAGEGGQTGAINTSEGGAFNPVYNAYDTPITPEETKTGRKIAGRDQVKKGVPVYNVNSWGIKYVTKENDWADDAHANDSDIERHKKLRPDLNFRQTGKPCAHCGKQGFEIEVQNPAHENKDWFSLAGTSHADRNNIVCPTCDAKQTRSRAGGVTGKPPKGGE